jgi:hypothetical protein
MVARCVNMPKMNVLLVQGVFAVSLPAQSPVCRPFLYMILLCDPRQPFDNTCDARRWARRRGPARQRGAKHDSGARSGSTKARIAGGAIAPPAREPCGYDAQSLAANHNGRIGARAPRHRRARTRCTLEPRPVSGRT